MPEDGYVDDDGADELDGYDEFGVNPQILRKTLDLSSGVETSGEDNKKVEVIGRL